MSDTLQISAEQAFDKAKPKILEPIMRVVVEGPADDLADLGLADDDLVAVIRGEHLDEQVDVAAVGVQDRQVLDVAVEALDLLHEVGECLGPGALLAGLLAGQELTVEQLAEIFRKEFGDLLSVVAQEVLVKIDRMDLVEGTYLLDVAVHAEDGHPYDYHCHLYSFAVRSPISDVGIYRPPHDWTFTPEIRLRDGDEE